MLTAIFTICAVLASLLGMVFYGLSGASGGIVIIFALALGFAMDALVAFKSSPEKASADQA